MINHLSECSKWALREYKTRHDWVCKVIHWEMCKKLKFDHTNEWSMQIPEFPLGKWDARTASGCLDKNGSFNLGQTSRLYSLVLVSAFTLVELNRLPPSNMLLNEEDTLGFDRGKGPKCYPEKRSVCRRFSTDTLTEKPEAVGCRNRHLLDIHYSPFSRVAALIPLGTRPIRLGWPYQGPKFLTT